jgi:tRNA(Ile)-lysidine synthase
LKSIDDVQGRTNAAGDRMSRAAPVFSIQALADVLVRLSLAADTPLKVAFSGGLDSHVLLHALVRLRRERSGRLSAIHVHHGLHPEAEEWARHCARICADLEVECRVERVHVADIREHGLEAAARRARYACLAGQVGPDEVLLTAHQRDDQAETVLLQLLRGAGVHGLAAMPEIAGFSHGRLARPLLGFGRAQLLAYAQEHNLRWIEDPSNRDENLARNFLRQRVFPLLQSRWPGASEQIARSAGFAAEAAAQLDLLAESDWNACRVPDTSALSVTALRRLPPPRARNLLRYWLRRLGFQAPSALHLEQILAQVAQEPRSRQALIRWPQAEVRRYRDVLVALKPGHDARPAAGLPWNPAEPLELPDVGLRLRALATRGEGLSQERIGAMPLTVRWRRGGEICRLPGRAHHHKLKKLLQEAHVPPWERRRLPLVYVDGALAAIGDRWVCEPFAARAGEAGWKLRLEPMPEI